MTFGRKNLYPSQILPKSKFIDEIDIDNISAKCSVYICRRIDQEDALLPNGKFKDEVWNSVKVQGMSWNLLGKYFLPEHNIFRTINGGGDYWIDGESTHLIETLNKYEIKPFKLNAYIPLEKINGLSIPISLEGPAQKDFINKTKIEPKPIFNKAGLMLTGSLNLVHKPTKLNYWHVQFLFKDYEAIPMKDDISSAKIKKFIKSDILGFFAKKEMVRNNTDIDKSFFYRN